VPIYAQVGVDNPFPNEGFGSPNSVTGFLWDVFDIPPQTPMTSDPDAGRDIVSRSVVDIWNAITRVLPCVPCDRVDRLWRAVAEVVGDTNALPPQNGPLSPETLTRIGPLLMLNKIAPEALLPPRTRRSGGGQPPEFQWTPNGDPSPAHENDRFMLVFSRDDFKTHKVALIVPPDRARPCGASSRDRCFKPEDTDEEWRKVLKDGTTGNEYKWFVAALRTGEPEVPQGWAWYSNVLSFKVRSLVIRITWSSGGDVDLHLRPPSGPSELEDPEFDGDVAWYNKSPGGAVLDRDCISVPAGGQCTEEISVRCVPATGRYRAFVHYYSSNGGPASGTATILVNGKEIAPVSFSLAATDAVQTLYAPPDVFPQTLGCSATSQPRELVVRRSGAGRVKPAGP
jgi:hypothetical protein